MFEAYTVGIRVSLINGVSAGLMQMARDFGHTHMAAKALNAELAGIKKTMLIGGALTAAGGGLFYLISKTLPAAKEYAHQLALMNAAGMRGVEIAQAQSAAYAAMKNAPTSSVTDNLAAIRELRMVFGNTNDAIANMPVVQRLQAILAVQHGDDMGAGRDDAYTVAKALELKGAVRTPGQFNAQADMMAKAIVASGGKVGPTDFLSAFKFGRTATAGWSDAFAYTILPTLIQEMKSSSGSGGGTGGPGNALMSTFQAVVAGQISQKSIPTWEKLGLLDPSKIVWNKSGTAKGVLPGGVAGSALFQQNPFQWAQQVLDPALLKAGVTSPEQIRETLGYLFPNRTAGFMMTQLATQGWKFTRDQGLISQASGLSGYNQLLKTDPYMAELALQKQWNSLMATLGFTIMPPLIRLMNDLIPILTKFTDWAHNHKGAVEGLMLTLTGLATVLTASGIITMLAGVARAFALVGRALGIGRMVTALPALGIGFGDVATAIALLFASPVVVVGGLLAGLAAAVWLLPRALRAAVDAINDLFHLKTPAQNGLYTGPRGQAPLRGAPRIGSFHRGPGHSWIPDATSPSPYVHPSSYSSSGPGVGNIYIDGRVAGKIIAGSIAKAANGPAQSSAYFDGRAGFTQVGSTAV